MNEQSQYWIWRLSNYTQEELLHIEGLGAVCSYNVYGFEISPSTGTPHLQGYIEFGRRKRGSAVKRILGERVHIERRRGTAVEASTYCKKEGDFREYGTISNPEQGKRSDLAELGALVRGGASEHELFDANPTQYIIHRRNLLSLRGVFFPPRDRPELQVYVLWGDPGVGKSRFVRAVRNDVWPVPSMDLKWFDGYSQQPSVIIDDYDGEGVNVRDFLRYIDIYAVQAPVKGGYVGWNPTCIWITSNISPDMWHPRNTKAVRRRLTRVMQVSDPINFSSEADVNSVKRFFDIE